MIKEKIMKQLAEAQEEEKILRAAVVNGDTAEARASAQEALDKVIEKIAEINDIIAELDKPAEDAPANDENGERKIVKISEKRGVKTMDNIEERAKAFAENGKMKIEARSTLVSGGKVATPTGVSGINDNFNEVSSIVDLVKIEDCQGMGANKVAYLKASATASTQTEGSAPTASDPTFDFVEIKPTSKIVVSYISKQVKKQSPLQYEEKVKASALTALRKEVASLISAQIKASALNTVVDATVTSGKGVVDEKTLRKIVLAYGGSEGVEGSAYLFLNKNDLIAFGDVRGTNDKKAVYEITPDVNNPNVGIIKDGGLSVKYCINSNLTACAGTAQAAAAGSDTVTMIYGNPLNCELDLFSDYEVAVSEDYKFAENMLAVRGDCEIGADVVREGGFVAYTIKKATA